MKRLTQKRPLGTSAPAPATQDDIIASIVARMNQLELRLARIDQALEGATQKRARDGHSGFWLRGQGQALSTARHAAGWTQRGLASALGVTHNTICLWETDRVDVPLWRAKQIVECFVINDATPPAWSFADEEG